MPHTTAACSPPSAVRAQDRDRVQGRREVWQPADRKLEQMPAIPLVVQVPRVVAPAPQRRQLVARVATGSNRNTTDKGRNNPQGQQIFTQARL